MWYLALGASDTDTTSSLLDQSSCTVGTETVIDVCPAGSTRRPAGRR